MYTSQIIQVVQYQDVPDLHEGTGVVPGDTLQLVHSGSGQVEAQFNSVVLLSLHHSGASVVIQLGCFKVHSGDDLTALLHECHVNPDIFRPNISYHKFLLSLQDEVFRTTGLADPDPVAAGDTIPGDGGTGWFPGPEHDVRASELEFVQVVS